VLNLVHGGRKGGVFTKVHLGYVENVMIGMIIDGDCNSRGIFLVLSVLQS
jgi:hypothetical protein